jgi:hypothetical protein
VDNVTFTLPDNASEGEWYTIKMVSDGGDYNTYVYDGHTNNWEESCDPCEAASSIEFGSSGIYLDGGESYAIDNVTIDDGSSGWDDGLVVYNNVFYSNDYGEIEPKTSLKGSVKGVKGVDTGGGELNLKGCEAVEMKNLDFHNVKVNIVDSKNIDMKYSAFKSDFPIKGSMVEFGGDSHDVTLSNSMFDMSYPEELHASIGIISTIEQPKPIKNVKEDVTMATSLSLTLWLMVFVVAITAAVFAKKANWRTLLWPIKKLFKRVEAEGKKVDEVWESIE